MSESAVKIYARICPPRSSRSSQTNLPLKSSSKPSHSLTPTSLTFTQRKPQETINNQKQEFNFAFDKVFDGDCGQEEIFDGVKDVIDGVLEGFNGTVFAYGMTGSGKTFTITGGPKSYADRGIIPRAIQHIFSKTKETTDTTYAIHVSYLEIYNEVGYDLLDASRDVKSLEDLPKVFIQEDAQERMHIKNLSMHPVQTQEQALDLLFQGDTTKIISSTPSNPSSSRSHCLFILTLSTTNLLTSITRRSKLHLVDLAGSERVGKTGVGGVLLREARYINLSLHYLEQVIVALGESKGGHVPYRNSLMTSLMRDSLGGNCRTLMVATVSTEEGLIEESIATCRFAQRVAMIKNTLTLTEEIDPFLTIERLKREIERLKAELSLAGGSNSDEALPEYELARVRDIVAGFLKSNGGMVFGDVRKINFAFDVLKEYVLKSGEVGENKKAVVSQPQYEKLLKTIAQRDNEIVILLQKLKGTNQLAVKSEVTNEHIPVYIAPRFIEQQPSLPVDEPHPTNHPSRSFHHFQRNHPLHNQSLLQKQSLAKKYFIAKSTGERAQHLRTEIQQSTKEGALPLIHEYKELVEVLKVLKSEIEHLQRGYDQIKLKIKMEYEADDCNADDDFNSDEKKVYDERRYSEESKSEDIEDDLFTQYRKKPYRDTKPSLDTVKPIHIQKDEVPKYSTRNLEKRDTVYSKSQEILQPAALLPAVKKDIRAEIRAFYEARDRILGL